jgi:hypothetical protein
MAPSASSHGEKRRKRRRKEKEGCSAQAEADSHEPQGDGAHRQRVGSRELGVPFFFFSFIQILTLFE